jgi:hypothetical protein
MVIRNYGNRRKPFKPGKFLKRNAMKSGKGRQAAVNGAKTNSALGIGTWRW